MGLDMYLTRKVHVANYSHDPKGQELANKIMDALGVTNKDAYKNGSFNIDLPEIYWRKANAIHGWFVDNVQEDKDECQEADVSRKQLKELRDLCDQVLQTKDGSLMEPRSGFFFGGVDVDEGYFDDMQHTRDQIDRILADRTFVEVHDGKEYDFTSFTYQSSW